MQRRAYLYFLLTFVLGVVLGGVGMFLYAWYGGHWHRQFTHEDFVRYLTKELKLDSRQAAQVGQIIQDSSKKYQALRAQARPQFEALRQQTDAQIRQLLTPEQSRQFDEMIRKRRQNPPHPPPARH
ncbi:MAG TPA: periplasmic heavy metal sensor [Terriglobia bacterium]|nr:periplasmic heavy metal sensor [Terriglobia bacterium]